MKRQSIRKTARQTREKQENEWKKMGSVRG